MIKALIKRIPILGPLAVLIKRRIRKPIPFESSGQYWESRYKAGGTSGPGSYGKLMQFKAEIINDFIVEHQVQSVIEFGCGDGNQVRFGNYPTYLGFDVSRKAVAICQRKFRGDTSKQFRHTSEYRGEQAEVALSLDVVYHLSEDEVYQSYMDQLFHAATRSVIVYASNHDEQSPQAYLRHRHFTPYVELNFPEWTLMKHIPNRYPPSAVSWGSFADFYVYKMKSPAA